MQQLIWVPGASLEFNMLKLKHGKFYNFLRFDISSFDSGNKKVSYNILRKHSCLLLLCSGKTIHSENVTW